MLQAIVIYLFYRIVCLEVDIYETRGSSYIKLPEWIANKKAVINPQNKGYDECLKWALIALIAVLYHRDIDHHPESITVLEPTYIGIIGMV